MATTIPEAITTIPAGTLRLLLTSIGYRAKARKEMRREPPMVPRRPPRPCCWAVTPGGRCRVDPVQVETLTPQQVRRVCAVGSVSALASNSQTAAADPAGLAWSAICCTLIYIIIIGGCAELYSVRRCVWYLVCTGGVAAL